MYYTTSCLFFEILPDEAPEMIHKISFPHQSSLHARVSLHAVLGLEFRKYYKKRLTEGPSGAGFIWFLSN